LPVGRRPMTISSSRNSRPTGSLKAKKRWNNCNLPEFK
jgi:hypothetical protein